MVFDGSIKGEYVDLTSVTEEDAEFTLFVRQDERMTRYLPKVTNSLEQQKAWITSQREKKGDYFFIAKDHAGNPVGTVGIYDIHGDMGESGRLTSVGNALQSLEIQYLLFKFVFEIIKLNEVTSYVYAENKSAYRLSEKLGVRFKEPSIDQEGRLVCYGNISREQFEKAIPGIERLLYRRK